MVLRGQMERALPAMEAKAEALRVQRDEVQLPDAHEAERFAALLEQLAQLRAEVRAAAHAPRHVLPFLQPGRLVRVMPEAHDPLVRHGLVQVARGVAVLCCFTAALYMCMLVSALCVCVCEAKHRASSRQQSAFQ